MRRENLEWGTQNFCTSYTLQSQPCFYDLVGVHTTLLYNVCWVVTVALTSFRIRNGTCITIDSICMNSSSSHSIKPAINGLSDHIAHLLVLSNTQTLFTNFKNNKQTTVKLRQ